MKRKKMAACEGEDDDVVVLAAAYMHVYENHNPEQRKTTRRRRRRRFWVHDINLQRQNLGEFHRLVSELRCDSDRFHQYVRMTVTQFDNIVTQVTPQIQRQCTFFTQPISPEDRLAITLRFLATGDSYSTMANSYRLGKSTVCNIINETCVAIWDALQPAYMPIPRKNDWVRVADDSQVKWQFPNCLRAVDGKHVVIKCPPNSGSVFYNYKGSYSIVLLAIVDAHYRFVIIDVGGYGKQSDGGTFQASEFGQRFKEGALDLPEPVQPTGYEKELPFVYIADEAFPLDVNMMRPYPGKNVSREARIFNYRLSRARRVVENAFWIMANRFRVYHRTIEQLPKTVDIIVKATCVLHNMLRSDIVQQAKSVGRTADDENYGDDEALGLIPLEPTRFCSSVNASYDCRRLFCDYFLSSVGALSWQEDM